jgi:hypothetical protein
MIIQECGYAPKTAKFSQFNSTRLEQQDRNLSEVKVDKVLGFMRDVAAEVASDDAVPRWVVLLVELLLDVSSNILLDVVLFQSLSGAVNSVLLHLLRHVGVLDYGFPLRHGSVDTCTE